MVETEIIEYRQIFNSLTLNYLIMKKQITMLFLGVSLFCSCQKTDLKEISTWNALSFTESQFTDYSLYMNEPHINITFPSKIVMQDIVYEKGIWINKNFTYVFTAHNWSNSEIVLHIYKENTLFNEFVLKPESSKGSEKLASMKDFSLSFLPTQGEYSFKISVKDSRGVTLLNTFPLHGGINKMIVY